MISHIPTSALAKDAPTFLSSLHQFWDSTPNFETPENLYRRLMDNHCQLWVWTGDVGKFIFVTEVQTTATAKILQITHTAGIKNGGGKWDKLALQAVISTVFGEAEQLAKDLNFDVLAICARPAHVKLAKDYETQHTRIFKRL